METRISAAKPIAVAMTAASRTRRRITFVAGGAILDIVARGPAMVGQP